MLKRKLLTPERTCVYLRSPSISTEILIRKTKQNLHLVHLQCRVAGGTNSSIMFTRHPLGPAGGMEVQRNHTVDSWPH